MAARTLMNHEAPRTAANTDRPAEPEPVSPTAGLPARYATLHPELVRDFERVAVAEKHWLMYTLLAWQHLIACIVAHEVWRHPDWFGVPVHATWPYLIIWLVLTAVAVLTVKLVTGWRKAEPSPLNTIHTAVWRSFLVLSINIVVLNALASEGKVPDFVFVPTVATLGAFAFAVLAKVISPRFTLASLCLLGTAILAAKIERYSFLIYGGGWLIALQSIAVYFYTRRKRWLLPKETDGQV